MTVFIIAVLFLFFLDQKMKDAVEEKMPLGQEWEVLGGKLIFRKLYNKGAMLGLLKEKKQLLLQITAIMTAGMTAVFVYAITAGKSLCLKIASTCMLGGALGNMFDRFTRGYVIDFFSFGVPVKKLRNIVFNLADLFIFAGAFFMLLYGMFVKKK